ncbi:MAG: DUF1292 domain-containing protein [Oscillospiraceae bacterium]|jgi:hypothetical protein|nr:DUF1292 domain-containing protein [Oscillospiraceae bacterium]
MDEEYGGDFVTITDDDGNDFELEHLDTIEMNDDLYMAFLPAQMDEDDENYGMVILKVLDSGGEEMLATVDNEDELNAVYNKFMEQLFGDELDDDEFEDVDELGEPDGAE